MNKPATPKVLIVFGTRPELIKLAPVIAKIEASEARNDFLLVSTSQHTELLKDQFDFWGFQPDVILQSAQVNGNLVRLLATSLLQLQDLIDLHPSLEYIIVQGDTSTALACANLAFLNQKKLVHIEAGLRTYDLQSPFPEEYNRVTVSKVAFFHFVPSPKNRLNLLKEGISENQIMVTGNTVIDAMHMSLDKAGISFSSALKNEVIITMHRRENAVHFASLIKTIQRLKASFPELHFTWVTHPNYAAESLHLLQKLDNVTIVPHLPYIDFIRMYKNARFVVTDSGGITEEASQLGIPVVVFRKINDRSEPLEMGHAMLVSREELQIWRFFQQHMDYNAFEKNYFGSGNASQLIFDWIKQRIATLEEPEMMETVIIGGGPAGTGLILKSMKDGTFEQFAKKGLGLIESSGNLVSGSITQYQVNSDTMSDVFLECLDGETEDYLDLKKLLPAVVKIRKYQGKTIPLPLLKPFLTKLGELIASAMQANPDCRLHLNTRASKIILLDDGTYRVQMDNGIQVACRNVVVATGGRPMTGLEPAFKFAGEVGLADFRSKTIQSDDLLRGTLSPLPTSPRIVILGGNHSAFSVADHLLRSNPCPLLKNPVRIWSRTKPKLFFPSREDAWLHGYTNFKESDICPLTNRVFRLAGLRMDGRQLYMDMMGLTSHRENRVVLNCYQDEKASILKDLQDADLIVHAFGYRFNMIPFTDERNVALPLFNENNHWVNERCQMMHPNGDRVPGLYATGLGTGLIPSGNAGGEASFEGQTNGFWYYQNVTAELIMSAISAQQTINADT